MFTNTDINFEALKRKAYNGRWATLEDGIIFDTVWIIKSNQFSNFSTTAISNNLDGSKSAKVRFELKDGPKHLQVDGTIQYAVHQQDEVVRMLSFTQERVLKLGKW